MWHQVQGRGKLWGSTLHLKEVGCEAPGRVWMIGDLWGFVVAGGDPQDQVICIMSFSLQKGIGRKEESPVSESPKFQNNCLKYNYPDLQA